MPKRIVETLICDNCHLQFEGSFDQTAWYKCHICGSDLWHMGQRPNNAVHLTPAAGGSRADNDTEPQVTADR